MIRLAVILSLLASPAWSQTRPVLRPDDLGLRVAPVVEPAAEAPAIATAPQDLAAMLIAGIQPCWNVGSLSPEAQEVSIIVAFEMTPDATPIRESIRLTDFSEGTQDAADEALGAAFRAIVRCGRDGLGLPAEMFEQWQRVEVRFDASSGASR